MLVATEDDYPPFEAVVNGKPVGYDHSLPALLRPQAGFEIRQEVLPWQGILSGVASGKYDAAVTAAVITDERAKSLDFTMPISESTMAYVKRTGDDRIKSIRDLSGMTLGVQQGGASFQVLLATGPVIRNQLIQLIKDSAFLSIITVPELTFAANYVQSYYFIPFESFPVSTMLYWILCGVIEWLVCRSESWASLVRRGHA
jgi:ABC-type amino acid transport substrate-binding protein